MQGGVGWQAFGGPTWCLSGFVVVGCLQPAAQSAVKARAEGCRARCEWIDRVCQGVWVAVMANVAGNLALITNHSVWGLVLEG